jgi:hypothetical protein
MSANGKQEPLRLGFLTAIIEPEKGFVGGLLVTNQCGRPLEFQCTLPVKPNATQELLYGPTLESFILGELIGGTLVDKAGIKPQLVLTDNDRILELRNHIDQPVALVLRPEVAEGASDESPRCMKLGRQIVSFHPAHEPDHAAVLRNAAAIPAEADLLEPFERVRQALQETLRSGTLK